MIPQNDPSLVDEILRKLKFSAEIVVQVPKAGTVSLREALLDHLQITRLTRKMVEAYATIGRCDDPCGPAQDRTSSRSLESYIQARGLIDLVYEFPEVLRDPVDLVAMLPTSLARVSTPSPPARQRMGARFTRQWPWCAIGRTIANVAASAPPCLPIGSQRRIRLPIYIQPNKRFRIPKEHYPAHHHDRSGHRNRSLPRISA